MQTRASRSLILISSQFGFMISTVKRRGIRLLVLLWLGWYLSGPLVETVDWWDGPREEAADVVTSAGGLVTLVGVAICLGFCLFRKWRDRCLAIARLLRRKAPLLISCPRPFRPYSRPLPVHFRPISLRI